MGFRLPLDYDVVCSLFDYDDGCLYHKIRRAGVKCGSRAGHISHEGYRKVRVLGDRHFEHRVIFLMHHGYVPDFIDHDDGDGLNNRIENLRELSQSDNMLKSKLYASNTSGYKGISFYKKRGCWVVGFRVGGRRIHVGSFRDKSDAVYARDEYIRVNNIRYCV